MAGPKSVEIAIRGRTDASLKRATGEATSALDKFAQAQRNTAKYRGLIESQRATAAAAKSAAVEIKGLGLAASGAQVQGFRAATAAAKKATDQIEAYKRAGKGGGSFAAFDQGIANRAGMEQAAVGVDRLARAIGLAAANQARLQRISAFEENARAAVVASNSVEALAGDLNQLSAAQTRAASATDRSTAALGRQAAASTKQDLASRITGAAASRTDRGPLGLRPYELQNLGYQVNDFFTQIASGTPATQAFAQQIGQVAQLFPAAISGALRLAPAIALITVALSPFVAAMVEANNEAENLKTFDILLTSMGDGANYNRERLAALATTLDTYGGSLGDARAALSTFVRDDVAPEYLERFGKSAINLSKVMKIDVTDAASQVSKAFTGNISDILSLDDSINFLSKSERDHIEVLKKSGKEAEARTEAFAIFERRYDETAKKMKGNWSTILGNFDAGWKNFVDTVNFIDFSKARSEINSLLGLIARLTSGLRAAQLDSVAAVDSRISQLEAQIASDNRALQSQGPLRNLPGYNFLATRRQAAASREITGLYQQRDALQARAQTPAGTTPRDTTLDPPDVPRQPAGRQPGKSDAEKESERLAKAQAEFNDDLLNANTSRARGIELLGETARETAILEAIEAARQRAADGKLEISDAQVQAIRDSVGASEDAKAAQEAFNNVSRQALELAKARGEVETRDAFIRRNLAEENLAIENEVNRIVRAARVDQLNQVYDAERRAEAEKKVNDLIAQRAAIMEQITFFRDNGDVAQADALQASLAGVNQAIISAAQNMLAFLATMAGPEVDTFRLKLQGIIGDAQTFGQVVVTSGKQINDSIADKGTAAFDRFSQAVAEGQNAFSAARDAFLQFAADFLREIALMIIKQAILNAIGGGGGTGGGAGEGIAGLINGLFRHDGGMVGSGGGMRAVSAAVFAGATRYHEGGIAGLKPGEIPTILERGEVVDPGDGSIFNKMFGGGKREKDVKIVNVFDPADFLDRALNSEAGERLMFNFVQRNGSAFKASIG